MPASVPTNTITANTSNKSKLASILAIIAAFAEAELPLVVSLTHNPETAAEIQAGVEGIAIVAAEVTPS